jgi:protocatechuate 3,4-dioxygenase beta subunit
MRTLLAALVTTFVTVAMLDARVDPRFLRMWNDAQKRRPATLASQARIAPANEPGTPFVVHGQVVDAAGKPAADVIVFAYHTDNRGVYAEDGAPDPWRLKGWARTDAEGRFEFRTIRPAPYPGGQVPAHTHATVATACCGRQFTELMFEGDPVLTPAYKARFASAGEHGVYSAIRRNADGSEEVDFPIRLRANGDF